MKRKDALELSKRVSSKARSVMRARAEIVKKDTAGSGDGLSAGGVTHSGADMRDEEVMEGIELGSVQVRTDV